MAYTVNIEFSGLCMFVPKPEDEEPARMHVVLPAFEAGESEHSMERHIPLLAFDAAHLQSSVIEPGQAGVFVLLDELVLSVPGSGATPCICPDVVDLGPVVGDTLREGVLDNDDDHLTVARADLYAGKMTRVAPGVCFKFGTGPARRIAHRARWTVEIDDAPPFALQLNGHHGNAGKEPLLLMPRADNNTIDLFVCHSPPGDLPPDPGEPEEPPMGTPAHHFAAYYRLFNNPTEIIPLFYDNDGVEPLGGTGAWPCDQCELDMDQGGSPYTCMVAGYTPPPG